MESNEGLTENNETIVSATKEKKKRKVIGLSVSTSEMTSHVQSNPEVNAVAPPKPSLLFQNFMHLPKGLRLHGSLRPERSKIHHKPLAAERQKTAKEH
jgi:hypothetical protein